jgi:hypothetical protein
MVGWHLAQVQFGHLDCCIPDESHFWRSDVRDLTSEEQYYLYRSLLFLE